MDSLVGLEGLHALKHAARFGARIVAVYTDDLERALALADQLAPDLRPLLESQAEVVANSQFRTLSKQPVPTRLIAYAEPPTWCLDQALPRKNHPTVLIDDPRNSKNLGAVIRLGAAVGAAGVLAHGSVDVCDPMAVRGAAGLQWALPCLASPALLTDLESSASPFTLIGLDASGVPFNPSDLPTPTIFAFGSERTGLSDTVRKRCDQIVSLPMEAGVSSLNLATSVSAVLYLMKYALPDPA